MWVRPRHEVGASIPVVLGRGDYRGVRGVRGQGVQGGPPPTVQGRGTSRGVQRGQGLGGVRGAGTGNGNFENFRGDRGGGRGVRDQRLRPVANVQPLGLIGMYAEMAEIDQGANMVDRGIDNTPEIK